jgi:hypothetical protein
MSKPPPIDILEELNARVRYLAQAEDFDAASNSLEKRAADEIVLLREHILMLVRTPITRL